SGAARPFPGESDLIDQVIDDVVDALEKAAGSEGEVAALRSMQSDIADILGCKTSIAVALMNIRHWKRFYDSANSAQPSGEPSMPKSLIEDGIESTGHEVPPEISSILKQTKDRPYPEGEQSPIRYITIPRSRNFDPPKASREIDMATQGLVSVVDVGGVILKIVTGTDGYNAQAVANRFLELGVTNVDRAYEIALQMDFGSKESLVVVGQESVRFEGEDELPSLYRETFKNPWFNPRWSQGTADHVLCVDLDRKRIAIFVDPWFEVAVESIEPNEEFEEENDG
ncbi:MAG: hypothetical protein AAF989_08010, partial [Planctomycetota bacterium]